MTTKPDPPQVDVIALIADDRNLITYRPSWNAFTKSVNGTILLQQIIYYWFRPTSDEDKRPQRKPFYKFNDKCTHHLYRPGDSWLEKTGFSRREFETARNRIAKNTDGTLSKRSLVSYWRDQSNLTWYALNEARLLEELSKIYASPPEGGPMIQDQLFDQDAEPAEAQPDGGNVHSGTAESANPERPNQPTQNGRSVHSRTADPANRSTKKKTETKTKKNQKEAETKTTPTAPFPYPTKEILAKGRVVGKPLTELSTADPTTALAWLWYCHLEQMEPKYIPGYIVTQLRENTEPPTPMYESAIALPALTPNDRQTLIEALHRANYQPHYTATDFLPEDWRPDLAASTINTIHQLYKSNAPFLNLEGET